MNEEPAITFTDFDARMMRRALLLAEQGKYTTSPNPRVGCVITNNHQPEPIVIGEGFHLRKGLPHAEREAFSTCSEDPSGGTLYVNLEPCCHHGATPPCTKAIIEAEIKRVVIANQDPFKEVSGKGIEELRQHGIKVDVGLLAEEAAHLNRYFFHQHQTGQPWVMLKAAVSLDGKMATHSGDSKWITGGEARRHVHQLRAEMDAILVGANTVRNDDPSLSVRLDDLPEDQFKQPMRVVLDSHVSISMQSKLVLSAHEIPVWVFVSNDVPQEKVKRLEDAGVIVIPVSSTKTGLNLSEVLGQLTERDILSVMVEGGGMVHTSFIESELVNEVCVYIAPVLIGGKEAPSLCMGAGKDKMSGAERLTRVESHHFGDDTLIRGILRNTLREL